MTGLGQLPCSDTPSPIPRLTRCPHAPQPALKPLGTAAWVPQKVRAQSTLAEENDRGIQRTGGPLPRSTRSHAAGHLLLSCTPTRAPTASPRHTAASGRLSAPGFEDRKAATGCERGSGCDPHSSPPPCPCPGLFFFFFFFNIFIGV